jgi:hypothetical protein
LRRWAWDCLATLPSQPSTVGALSVESQDGVIEAKVARVFGPDVKIDQGAAQVGVDPVQGGQGEIRLGSLGGLEEAGAVTWGALSQQIANSAVFPDPRLDSVLGFLG